MRNDLSDEGLSIREDESKKRSNDRRLSGSHDHLMTHRPIVLERLNELVDKNNLTLAQHEGVGEFKDEESRVELNGRRADLHKVTLGSQISSDLRCLQRDLLAQTTLLLRVATALDIPKEQDELLQPVAR